MQLPSTKTLRVFQLAARFGSFKTASAHLFLTPSAVSHQIKSLEESLGIALFHRSARQLTLTDAGASYFSEVETLFTHFEKATRQLRIRFGRNVLRLRVAPYFAEEFLLPRIAALHESQPEVDLQIDTNGAGTEIHPRDADVSIVLGTGPWADLDAHPLFRQTYVPACAPALLASNSTGAVELLGRYTLLVHEAHKDAWALWAEAAGIQLPQACKSICFDTMTAMVRAAESSAGIGLVPARLAADRFRANSLMTLFGHELRTADSYFLVHRTEVASRPDVLAFRRWLLAELPASSSI